jgi:hypothetical protein
MDSVTYILRRGVNLSRLLLPILLAASPAAAVPITLVAVADGDVKTFGTDEIDTVDDRLHLTQSGGLERRVILEFTLGAIPVGAAINSVELAIVKDGTMSNTGGDPIPIHLYAYPGDGVVGLTDYGAVAPNVGDYSVALGAADGTEFVWALTVAAVQDAFDFAGGPLSVRIETDNFAILEFASLETGTLFAPPELRIG